MRAPVSDFFKSIVSSIQRNGWLATAGILINYVRLKNSGKTLFPFFVADWNRSVFLRPTQSDFSVFRQITMNGEYDIEIPKFPKIIIDAGANIGLSSLHFHYLFPDATIFSFEPDPGNFELLLRNTRDIPQIRPIQQAVWFRREPLSLSTQQASAWSTRVETVLADEKTMIQGVDLFSFMEENRLLGFDILKMDIEGAELELFLHQPEQWLARTGVLIVELHELLRPGVTGVFSNALAKFPHTRTEIGENILIRNLGWS
jgi:FkbM family methyltransferase